MAQIENQVSTGVVSAPGEFQPVVNEGPVRGIGLMEIKQMPELPGSSQSKPRSKKGGEKALITQLGVINNHSEDKIPSTDPETQTFNKSTDSTFTGSSMATANTTYTGNNADDISSDDAITYPE